MFELDTGLIFWTIISFLILLFLLYKLVFPPLYKLLDQRKKAIEGGLAQAEQAKHEAEDLLRRYQGQLAEAEKKTALMFDEARRKSQVLRDDTLKIAQKEAQTIIESTKSDIDAFRNKAVVSLKEEIAEIIVDVNKRLIGKTLDRSDQLRLVKTSIEELEKNVKG
ncbi:MAG: F0F1 ATP synthase subunit B [Candidatus Margulisbacteria bacterium]|nr:F0F1 ATP synthase subunit B [Candidatus Margulisiibacteriota bacterium]